MTNILQLFVQRDYRAMFVEKKDDNTILSLRFKIA